MAGAERDLAGDPDVARYEFIDRSRAYSIFETEFAGQPEILKGVTPADLPVSFRVFAKAGVAIPVLTDRYRGIERVSAVISAQDSLGAATKTTNSECSKP